MRALIQIPLSPYSGYGRDGIGLSQAFIRAGIDTYLEPTEVQAPLPDDVLELLGKTPQAPFDLIIQHVDPQRLEAMPTHRRSTKMLIGWTMWEWNSLSNAKNRSKFRQRFKNFDAILAYDSVTAEALKEYYSGPIIVLQGGFDPSMWEKVDRDWDDIFRFIQIGVLSERKNPWASIRAFAHARSQDEEFRKHARLMLKTVSPGLHSGIENLFMVEGEDGVEYPTLRIFYEVWPTETVKKFYESAHVLLAPSRGEGKNLPALEFMSTGGTVIGTDWGGHSQWMDSAFAFPLGYKLQAFDPDYPKALSAEVDVDQMAENMLYAFRHRHETKAMGDKAAQAIPARHSWDAVTRRLFDRIKEIPGGDEVRDEFLRTQREDYDDE